VFTGIIQTTGRVERRAAARAVSERRLGGVRALGLAQSREGLAFLLGEEAVFLGLLPLLQALSQAILGVFHGSSRAVRRAPSGCRRPAP
jgi:hypothetical protein